MTKGKAGWIVTALIGGALTGVVAGLLLAPKTGRETRKMLKTKFGSLKNRISKPKNTDSAEDQDSVKVFYIDSK